MHWNGLSTEDQQFWESKASERYLSVDIIKGIQNVWSNMGWRHCDMDELERLVILSRSVSENEGEQADRMWEELKKIVSGIDISDLGDVIIHLFGVLVERHEANSHALLHVIYNEFHPRMTGELN